MNYITVRVLVHKLRGNESRDARSGCPLGTECPEFEQTHNRLAACSLILVTG